MSHKESFPSTLTEEEKHLTAMFEWLRRLRTAVREEEEGRAAAAAGKLSDRRRSGAPAAVGPGPRDSRDATEAAKRLAASGALNLARSHQPKSSFKRSAQLDKRLKDSASSQGPKFTPYSQAMLGDYAAQEESQDRKPSLPKPGRQLYSNFVSGGSTGPARQGGAGPGRGPRGRPVSSSSEGGEGGGEAEADGWGGESSQRPEEEGRALLVRGFDLMEEPLRAAFQGFGGLESLAIDDRRRSATIAFAQAAAAARALKEMNGNMVNGVTLRVSLARGSDAPHPGLNTSMDEPAASHPWAQPPAAKQPKKEPPSRSLVSYEDNPF